MPRFSHALVPIAPKSGSLPVEKGIPSLFVDRIVDRDGSHLKGYAGEVLTLVAILFYFRMEVSLPSGRFLEDCVFGACESGHGDFDVPLPNI